MSRKKKNLPLLENITITGLAAEGNAIARRPDEPVLFVPYGAPGDVVNIQVTRKKGSWMEGRITEIVSPSPERVEPRCEHFGTCGGCRWQHLPYEVQLQAKQQQVSDAIDRIAKVEHPAIQPILGSDPIFEYRNKMEYTFSNRRWLTFEQMASGEEFTDRDGAGFHIPGAFDKVLDITRCHLQEDFSNRLRLFIRDYARQQGYTFYDLRNHGGLLRTLMVRTASTGQKMALMVFGEDNPEQRTILLDAIRSNFPELTSLVWAVNTKVNDSWADLPIELHSGMPYIEEEMEGLRFRIDPKSFYQTNSRQAYRLYSVVRELAGLTGNELVYDLYTGTGTIALFLARHCRHVVGIEYVEAAIADARINAEANALNNTEFYSGDMKDVLTDEFIAGHGVPDVMIVDPPRAGMHQDVTDTILRAAPRRIVYVSCNPATQARDLALLDTAYRVDAIQPVDMFPHTHHVENVVLLNRC